MIILCETWTSELSNIDLAGYESFSVHRKRPRNAKRDSGGIIAYIKSHLSPGIELLKQGTSEIIWFKLCKQFFGFANDVLLCVCYIVPDNSTGSHNYDTDPLDQILFDMSVFGEKQPTVQYFEFPILVKVL